MSTTATASLWELLCQDLETRKSALASKEHVDVAAAFVDSARKVLRPNSERLADAYEIAGDICEAAGATEVSARYYRRAFDLCVAHVWNASGARAAAKMSFAFEEMKRYREAASGLQSALGLFEAEGDYSQHVSLLMRLAAVRHLQGDRSGMKSAFEKALGYASQVHGKEHPRVADVLNNHAVALTEIGELEEAETFNTRALSIRENSFGPNHPDVGQSLGNLAVIYHLRGDTSRAANYYQAALATYETCGETGSSTHTVLQENFDRLQHDLNPSAI
jgi:tetratricopeptide (TPR) repeat protein